MFMFGFCVHTLIRSCTCIDVCTHASVCKYGVDLIDVHMLHVPWIRSCTCVDVCTHASVVSIVLTLLMYICSMYLR